MNVRCGLCLLLLALAATPPALAQRVLFVDASAGGIADGRSWTDAFTALQDALAAAEPGDEIWVAAGVYRPDQGQDVVPGDRAASFQMKDGVALYGGFAGTEMRREERDRAVHETILSGDLLDNDNDNVDTAEPTRQDNSYYVITAHEVDPSAIIDGFTVTAGNGNGGGGGMLIYSSPSSLTNPTLRHLRFSRNAARSGGGLAVHGAATLEDIVFINNYANHNGGGMYVESWPGNDLLLRETTFEHNRAAEDGGGLYSFGSLILINSTFLGNHSGLGGGFHNDGRATLINARFLGNTSFFCGAGMLNSKNSTHALLLNVVFSGNQAFVPDGIQDGGGGFCNFESSATLINVTFSGNTSTDDGGALYNEKSDLLLANVVVWGNEAAHTGDGLYVGRESRIRVVHSLLQGGLPEGTEDGGGNRFVDPLFVDPDGPDDVTGTRDDNLRLEWVSPAIDAGDTDALPPDAFDLDGDGDTTEPLPIDLDGRVRVFDGGSGRAAVDMGTYEFDAPPVLLALDELPTKHRDAPFLEPPAPNPFASHTTLRFRVPQAMPVQLVLYDAQGRRVRVLYAGTAQAGETYAVPVDGAGLPSGAYFARLKGTGLSTTRPLLLIR